MFRFRVINNKTGWFFSRFHNRLDRQASFSNPGSLWSGFASELDGNVDSFIDIDNDFFVVALLNFSFDEFEMRCERFGSVDVNLDSFDDIFNFSDIDFDFGFELFVADVDICPNSWNLFVINIFSDIANGTLENFDLNCNQSSKWKKNKILKLGSDQNLMVFENYF